MQIAFETAPSSSVAFPEDLGGGIHRGILAATARATERALCGFPPLFDLAGNGKAADCGEKKDHPFDRGRQTGFLFGSEGHDVGSFPNVYEESMSRAPRIYVTSLAKIHFFMYNR